MKAMYFFAVIILIAGCNQLSKSNDIKESIPGEYIYTGGTEFSRGTDTLNISEYDVKAGTYVIIRKTGFTRIVDGIPQVKEYKTEKMMATYDEQKHQLQDTKTGRLLSFNNNRDELLFGTAPYRKIK